MSLRAVFRLLMIRYTWLNLITRFCFLVSWLSMAVDYPIRREPSERWVRKTNPFNYKSISWYDAHSNSKDTYISAVEFHQSPRIRMRMLWRRNCVHDAMSIDENAWPSTPDQLLINRINILLITSREPRRLVSHLESCNLTAAEEKRERESERVRARRIRFVRARTTVCGLPWMTIRYSFPARIIAGFTAKEPRTTRVRVRLI